VVAVPVAAEEPAAVAAVVAEPLQVTPAEIKAAFKNAPAPEPAAVTVAVSTPEPFADSVAEPAAIGDAKPEAPAHSNSFVPVIAAVVAGLTAAAATVSLRLRSKRKTPKSRNKS